MLQARADRHRLLLREVNRIIVGELEDLEGAGEGDYAAVVEQVERDDK